MKYKSKAISLIYIRHGNTSIISKILTEERGLQSFIIKGVRSRKSKKKLSYFEPLTLLNIDAKFNAKKSLQYLGEINTLNNFEPPVNKIHRRFIAFFVAEVSSRVLQENEQNTELFDFVWNTAVKLYSADRIAQNFPIRYLLDLSKLLGFYPSVFNKENPFFELESGEFLDKKNPKKTYFNNDESSYLRSLISDEETIIPQTKKSEFLKKILSYYKTHHYNLDGVKSHLVIEALRT